MLPGRDTRGASFQALSGSMSAVQAEPESMHHSDAQLVLQLLGRVMVITTIMRCWLGNGK